MPNLKWWGWCNCSKPQIAHYFPKCNSYFDSSNCCLVCVCVCVRLIFQCINVNAAKKNSSKFHCDYNSSVTKIHICIPFWSNNLTMRINKKKNRNKQNKTQFTSLCNEETERNEENPKKKKKDSCNYNNSKMMGKWQGFY